MPPAASRPAAAPAVVASSMVGKALLVPVESGISGASSQPLANARLVPSPPSTSTAAAPLSSRAASSVSAALAVADIGNGSATTPVSSTACLLTWWASGM